MRYNWHRVAEKGALPSRFRHGLVSVGDESTSSSKVYAIGREEGRLEEELEVFELDNELENWSKVPFSFENELATEAAKSRREFLLTGVGSTVYWIDTAPDSNTLLKLDTVNRIWRIDHVSVRSAETLQTVAAAAAAGERIVLLGNSTKVSLLDTVGNRWEIPKILGTPPHCARNRCSCLTIDKEKILVSDDNGIWLLQIEASSNQQRFGHSIVEWSKGRRDTLPVVVCGPSGVGKGTLIAKLMQDFPDKFGFSVSHTTRKPREREVDGVHYHFTSREKMELAISDGKFLEYANVHGNLYGTSIAAVEAVSDRGKRCILDIDVQGAKSVRESSMEALFIFILPPSFEELEKRLRGRGTETEEQVMKRLQNAKRELELGKDSSLFDIVLVNDDLESTYNQLKNVLGLVNDAVEDPASLKLVVQIPQENEYTKVNLVKVSADCTKWQRLEPSEKHIQQKYTNTVHLGDLKVLMTANDGESIIVRPDQDVDVAAA